MSSPVVRLPGDAAFPEVRGLKGPLSVLNEARFGIIWGAVGSARSCFLEALDYLRSQLSLAMSTEDIVEGVSAFFEQRDPQWKGR